MASNSKTSHQSKYYLVLFLANNKNNQEVDIVPASWMFRKNNKDPVRCKFMPGPYNKSRQNKLNLMIQNCVGPKENWPDYAVEIRGRADNYEQAEERLSILKSEPYAFTTDNEKSAKSQALKDEKLFKIKTTNNNDKLKSKLNSVNLKFNNAGESSRNEISNSEFSKSLESSVGDDSGSSTTLSQQLKRNIESPKNNSNKRQKLNNSKSSCTKNCDSESSGPLESSADSNSRSQTGRRKKLSKKAKSSKELQQTTISGSEHSKSSESSLVNDSKTQKQRLKRLRESIRARQGNSRSDNSKLNDSGSSNLNNNYSFHNSSQEKKSDKADSKTRDGNNNNIHLCESSALEKISSFQNLISSTPITNKLNKNLADKGLSQDEVIQKYFVSLSKQIGQLTSLTVQHGANLNNIMEEIRDIKKRLKKNCSCDGGHDGSSGESSDNDDKEAGEETESAGEKIKKFDYPINEKETFEEFNKQLDDKPHERKIVIKRIHQLVNVKESLNNNMKVVIKAYITRSVVISYVPSAVTLSQKKPIFKNTAFYKCIEEVMRLKLKDNSGNVLTDSDMLKAMAFVLRNARDWNGHRLLRTQKIDPPASEDRT